MMKTILSVLFLTSSLILNAQISNQNLLAYYPFDGNFLDAGPNGFHGINNGATFGEDENGNFNSALFLDGSDDFVDISAFSTLFRENLDQMTILFKVRFVKETDGQDILSLGTQGELFQDNVFEVEYENDRLQIEPETGIDAINHEFEIDQTESLFTGEWHRMMISIDGENVTYCRNGVVVFEGTYIPAETLASNFFIGCWAGDHPLVCCFFGGFIDDLQFYGRSIEEEDREYVCTPCVDPVTNLLVDQDFDFGERSFQEAINEITSTSTINLGANVTFRAGNGITLEPGFTASLGSLFEAYLVDCIDDNVANIPANSIVQDLPEMIQMNTDTPVKLKKETSLKVVPNPFSTNATIGFTLEQASSVVIRVADLNGSIVETLANGTRYESGIHQLDLDAKDLPNGIYFLQMITETDISVVQLVLSK